MSVSRLLGALAAADVEFVVVGGIAALVQGAPVVTFDVDVVHSRTPENVRRLLQVLIDVGATYVRGPGAAPIEPREELLLGEGHHLLTTRFGRLDVLGRIEGGRGYEELLPSSVEVVIDDARVQVLSLATLAEIKRTSSRPKDRAMVPILEAVLRRTTS